jgi:ribonuclease P protein component
MRRRLRALVRAWRLGSLDLVIRADREAMTLTYQELEDHLSTALSSATRGNP